jgi:hypothetical protein
VAGTNQVTKETAQAGQFPRQRGFLFSFAIMRGEKLTNQRWSYRRWQHRPLRLQHTQSKGLKLSQVGPISTNGLGRCALLNGQAV